MAIFKQLRIELEKYLDEEQIAEVHKAFLVANEAHQGQLRLSGEPYITHPVAVACILAEMHMDIQTIMAALLHDVIEDTETSKNRIAEEFGDQVAELVDGVSKLTQIKFSSRVQAQAENFRKMVLAMVKDIRVIMVKLADRLHNMRTISSLPPVKRRRIAKETLEIYAPIANRLGMNDFRLEFEDLGFKALYPLRARILQTAVKNARGNRKEIIITIEKSLHQCLERHGLKKVSLFGREKHLYSIYKKMRNKHLAFSEIMDVYAFRIVVENIDNCYRALGAVHNLYKPVPERFKDYIAIPKANGYQSLHTTLFGPYGVPIEIQIRSEEMNKIAERGIASHWLYKSDEAIRDNAELRAREWIKGLLELQKSTGDSIEFIENVKIDLFPDEVYVFTPKGAIMKLPSGACAVDFAYAVHSEVGNTCVAAKIDKHLAPLSTQLKNGQTVEVITAPGAHPNPAWLNFVVTGKAQSNIRHSLNSMRRSESISLGRSILEKAFASLGIDFSQIEEENLKSFLNQSSYKTMDDLLEAIGLGNEMALLIAQRIASEITLPQEISTAEPAEKRNAPLLIKGSEGVVLHFAECCRPIPGDPIIGYLCPGQGLIIHQQSCKEAQKSAQNPDKWLFVSWEENILNDFKVDIIVEVENQRGVLASLGEAIADAEADIENISVGEAEGRFCKIYLTLSVRDRIHLARIMRRVRRIKFVTRIYRKK